MEDKSPQKKRNTPPRLPRLTAEEIKEHTERFSRVPFQKILVEALENAPSPNKIGKFADKSPDRYAQYVTQFAKLAGYNDKLEIDITHKPLTTLSDSELLQRLEALERQLNAVDITPQLAQLPEIKKE